MRRAVLAAASTATLVVLLLTLKPHQSDRPALAVPAPSGTATASPAPGASPRAGASTAGGTGGTYTGDPVNTQYGTVQVSATVRAGKLTAVKILQAPSGDGHSRRIADYAVPRLNQEALAAHSAHIDSVSGASYTSQGYIDSLQSALDKAGA
ncbi:FMN-binding protein [Streptomyces sp. NBC_01429]|uniref:FMN-binding protein n=1 Tax=Streptomyces sp. NBC_01429 TaxID=2903862 RepID=UPI002E29A397|nr:FMN-binding protein [Streptomyces sp. NBC_01429]